MKPTHRHLNDEHMRLYEWSGLTAPVTVPLPAGARRSHSWHASYGVLAVLTSLLILNGCDRQTAAEQASEQVGKTAQEPPAQPLDDTLAPPADAAAPAAAGPEQPGASSGPATEGGGQSGEPAQQP